MMGSRRRLPSLLLLLCGLARIHAARLLRNGSSADVTVVGKVTEMLQQMEARSVEVQQQANLEAADMEQGCSQEIGTKTAELDSLKLQVQGLEAAVTTGEGEVAQLKQDILQLDRDIMVLSSQLEALHMGRTNQSQTFSQELADLNFAVASVDRAIDVLRAQQPQALLATAVREASEDHSVQELVRRSRRYMPDDGGIAKDEHIFDDFENLTTAQGAYVHVSDSIEGMLNGLKQSFESQKSSLLNQERTDHVTFQQEEQSFEDRLKLARDDQAMRKTTLATNEGELVNKQQELAQSRQNEVSTAAYLEHLREDCAARRQAYEEVRLLRESELRAIQAALQIITGQLVAIPRPVLLRVRQAADTQPAKGRRPVLDVGEAALGARKVVGFLRLEAQQLQSLSLGNLATQLGVLIGRSGQGSGDPLAEVKVMISDLIERLKQQSLEEASHNAWCETELTRNEEAQTSAKGDLESHSARAQKLNGDIQKLGLEVADLNTTISQNQVRKAQLAEQRTNQSNESAQVIADAETSAVAVEAAIALLEEYYANLTRALQAGFQAPTGNTSAGASANASANASTTVAGNATAPLPEELRGVVSMLEVVRDDYRSLGAKTQAAEDTAARAYVEESRALEVADAAAVRSRDLKQAEHGVLLSQLAQAHENVNTSTQELQEAERAYEALKPPCLDVETYEERKMRRDTEIQALQEAYNMLVQYAQEVSGLSPTFLQSRTDEASKTTNTSQQDNTSETIAGLLRDIRAEVAADLAADTQVYTDMDQWCSTTVPQLQASLAQNQDRERELMTTIETSAQGKAELEVQVAQLEAEVAKEQASLEQHAQLRARELQTFHDSETELLLSTQKLSQAIGILKSHFERSQQPALNASAEQQRLEGLRRDIYANVNAGGGQDNSTTPTNPGANSTSNTSQDAVLIRVASDVQQALRSLPAGEARLAAASAEAGEALQGFLARPQDLFLHSAYGSRASLAEFSALLGGSSADSQQVFGVLQQLLETFQEDLQALRAKEQQDSADSVGLTDTKREQIAALEASLASKRTQLAQHSTTNADAKTDLAFLRESYQADAQRLLDVQQSCADTQQEFQIRNATRQSELRAIDEAIAILASDDTTLSGGGGTSSSSFLLHGGASGHGRVFSRPRTAASVAKPHPQGGKEGAAGVVDAFLRAHRRGQGATSAKPLLLLPEVAGAQPRRRLEVGKAPSVPHSVAAGSRRLAAVATHVHVNLRRQGLAQVVSPLLRESLDRVAAEIDLLVASVEREGQLEARMRETCLGEERQAREQLERRETEDSAHNATINRLNATISSLDPEMESIRAEIQALNSSLTAVQSTRVQEQDAFHQAVERELAHQAKLHRALEALRRHYGSAGVSLLHRSLARRNASTNGTGEATATTNVTANSSNMTSGGATETLSNNTGTSDGSNATLPADEHVDLPSPTPNATLPPIAPKPQTFSRPLTSHEGSRGILGILELLIGDSQTMVESMSRAEESARDAHGVDQTNVQRSIDDKDRQLIELGQKKGDAEQALQQTEVLKAACEQEIGQINAFLAIVANKCTTLLNNYATNQDQRNAELASLRDAKFYLQGMVGSSGFVELSVQRGGPPSIIALEALGHQLRGTAQAA